MSSHPIILQDPEDSLFDDPLMKKFMRKAHQRKFSQNQLNRLNVKKIQPGNFNLNKINSRKKIQLISPSKSRISFFTQQNQQKNSSKIMMSSRRNSNKLLNWDSYKTTSTSQIKLRKKHSNFSLKPKSQLLKLEMLRKKFVMDDPFKQTVRESQFV